MNAGLQASLERLRLDVDGIIAQHPPTRPGHSASSSDDQPSAGTRRAKADDRRDTGDCGVGQRLGHQRRPTPSGRRPGPGAASGAGTRPANRTAPGHRGSSRLLRRPERSVHRRHRGPGRSHVGTDDIDRERTSCGPRRQAVGASPPAKWGFPARRGNRAATSGYGCSSSMPASRSCCSSGTTTRKPGSGMQLATSRCSVKQTAPAGPSWASETTNRSFLTSPNACPAATASRRGR
jgi:hypothetical protein